MLNKKYLKGSRLHPLFCTLLLPFSVSYRSFHIHTQRLSFFFFLQLLHRVLCAISQSVQLVPYCWTLSCFQPFGITVMPQAITLYICYFTLGQAEVGLHLNFCYIMTHSPLQRLYSFPHSSISSYIHFESFVHFCYFLGLSLFRQTHLW